MYIPLPKIDKIYIYNGTEWVKATPYIYNGTEWVKTTPYIWNGTEWK